MTQCKGVLVLDNIGVYCLRTSGPFMNAISDFVLPLMDAMENFHVMMQ